MRYAIYFTPPPDHPLTRAAGRWLGRDVFGAPVAGWTPSGDLSAAELAFHTAAARRYGFHATLKAPFRLASGETETTLADELDRFCLSAIAPVVPRLVPRQISGFFALVPETANPALNAFAGEIVRRFDRFRAPMTDLEIERRNPDSLSPGELKNLNLWGYPYVFDDFRFHMTLTGRATGRDAERLSVAIDRHFREFLDQPLEIASIGLFVEPEPGAPFAVRSLHLIPASPVRKTA